MKLAQLTLPIYLLTTLQNAPVWNISRVSFGKDNRNHNVLNNDTLAVFYPSGSYTPSIKPQGGIGFFASPNEMLPAESITLQYQVQFDDTFDPVLGGKLPGLFISKGKEFKASSGGKHDDNSASVRIAWRKNFDAELYVYLPSNQDPAYDGIDSVFKNKKFGDSLWRGDFKLYKSVWNNISISVKLNDVNKKNGLVNVTINGINRNFDKICWRQNKSSKISAVFFQTFFGGSTAEYATPHDTWSYFRNITLSKT